MNEKINILIVEDDVSFANVIEVMLRRTDLAVNTILCASTVEKAITQSAQINIGVVLLDLTLPDSSGLRTVSLISQQINAPIVVLTGDDDKNLANDALAIGAQDYLVKDDISHNQLARAINYAVERQKSNQLAAEKLRLFEQREDFIATLTHDLQNPLIGANRVLDLLTDGTLGKLSDQQARLLLSIKDSNDALIVMIRNLLEVYKFDKDFDSLKKENTDLSALVVSYIKSIKPILNDKEILVTLNCQNIGAIPTDQVSMMRVIQNLVGNAIKFTPRHGHIQIKLWYEHPKAYFQITDSGPGVPEEERSRLFQRFFQGRRGKASETGTGLGLYLCRQIIEAHHGAIWCENYTDRTGATFTLELPSALKVAS
ncbi:MAG: HAMP domain-containing histidine kinase [Cyanobacteria bacterium SZAS-4]|nr:HAMP domain-containing histidine kinase [Cyanobacteria bacterium SZAS-4]